MMVARYLAMTLALQFGLACATVSQARGTEGTKSEPIRALASRTREAIVRHDTTALLMEIGEAGVSCLDSSVSKDELRIQLNSKSGLLFALLYDTRQLQEIAAKWGAVPSEMISFQEYFKSNSGAVLVVRGESESGVIQWQTNPGAIDMHSPRFEYRRDVRKNRYFVVSIGCN